MYEINKEVLESLEVGMDFDNYKELCKHLNQKICKGNSKKAQLKTWNRYFEFINDNYTIKITKIHHESLKKLTYGRNSIYVPFIETLLLEMLANTSNGMLEMTSNKLYKELGMCNNNYEIGKEKYNLIAKQKIPTFFINDFYRRSSHKMKQIITNSLESLRNRYLIEMKQLYKIVEQRNNELIVRTATEEDEINILKTKHNVMTQLGFDNKKDMYLACKFEEFYEIVNLALNNDYGWESCYIVNRILSNKQIIKQELAKPERKHLKSELNQLIKNKLNKDAENKAKKMDETKYVYPIKYIEAQKLLCDYLIDIERNM